MGKNQTLMDVSKCAIILKAGSQEFNLNAYQHPCGLTHQGMRPNVDKIDCQGAFNQPELFRLAEYLRTIAYAMTAR